MSGHNLPEDEIRIVHMDVHFETYGGVAKQIDLPILGEIVSCPLRQWTQAHNEIIVMI